MATSSIAQSIARCQFQLSRRDREFLPFSLMLRDEIENFFPSVSCFETRSRISSLRSHAPGRDREFLSSLSCFETRPRRMLKKNALLLRDGVPYFQPRHKGHKRFSTRFHENTSISPNLPYWNLVWIWVNETIHSTSESGF